MKNQNQKPEFKEVVEDLITNLRKNGVDIEGAALLKLNDLQERPDQALDEIIKKTLDKAAQRSKKQENGETLTYEETCFCGNCFTFQKFEEVLGPLNGRFDYQEFKVGGKNFRAKYWTNGKAEHMLIQQEGEEQVEKKKSLDELKKELNQAINQKEYAKGQLILNQIQELKNQA